MTNRHAVVRLIVAALSLFAIILALGVLVFYVASRVRSAVATTVAGRAALAKRAADISLLLVLRDGASRALPYESALRNVLPTYDRLYLFGNEVRRLAREHNADASFVFGKTTELPGESGRVSFSLTFRGSYDDITSFLSSLEASAYFVSLSSVDMFRQTDAFRGSAYGEVFFSSDI